MDTQSEHTLLKSHQGNVNQNYIEIPSHPNQNGYHEENKEKQQMLVRTQRKGTLIYCCELAQNNA
jgi:hypothetical protein